MIVGSSVFVVTKRYGNAAIKQIVFAQIALLSVIQE